MPSFPLTALEFEVKKNVFVSVTVNGLKRTWWDMWFILKMIMIVLTTVKC